MSEHQKILKDLTFKRNMKRIKMSEERKEKIEKVKIKFEKWYRKNYVVNNDVLKKVKRILNEVGR